MTKSKSVKRIKSSNNIVAMEMARREKKLGKRMRYPATQNDSYEIDTMEIAANPEKTEILIGETEKFENEKLLETLGFERNSNGVLVLHTEQTRNLDEEDIEKEEESVRGA